MYPNFRPGDEIVDTRPVIKNQNVKTSGRFNEPFKPKQKKKQFERTEPFRPDKFLASNPNAPVTFQNRGQVVKAPSRWNRDANLQAPSHEFLKPER
jgi:hypothetical protein